MIPSLINEFKQYKKFELYKWLLVSALHPSNQRFIIRYELLIHTLLAIPEQDFLNNRLSRITFEHLIRWFERKYSQSFMMMEDWEPFEQTQLIPIFFEKKKYYFFYGASERPYEAIIQFQEILFTQDIEELQNIKKEFGSSLKLQTDVLVQIVQDDEAKARADNMCIPTSKSINRYFNLFKINAPNKDFLHNSKTEYEMGINNFNGLYTIIDDHFFILPPQCHIETLYQYSETFLYYEATPDVLAAINQAYLSRSKKSVIQFFGIRQILDMLIDPITKIDVAEYFDSIVRVDADKILLFKNIIHSDIDLADAINETAKQSIEEVKKIQENPWIGLKYINNTIEEVSFAPVEVFEFKVILIYEKLTLNYLLAFEENWKEKDIYIFNLMDIKPIFDLLREKESDTDISFTQYLEAEKKQAVQNKSMLPQMDALDSFAFYYQKESFIIAGKQPDMMLFVPHEWSDFYNNYLFSKYQDNIYELIEKNFPNRFNFVEHMSGDTYNFMDTGFIKGGRCIKFQNSLIWIIYPIAINCIENEVRTFEFLGQFFSFYIDKYKDNLFELFSKYGFNITRQDFIIEINPDSLIKRTPALSHLADALSTLSSKKINFTTKQHSKSEKLHTFITYTADEDTFTQIFKMNIDDNPEKDIFKKFIISVLNFYKEKNINAIVEEFIEKNWNIDERAFSFDTTYVDNPRLQEYSTPKKLQNSFVSHVIQDIVTYLKDLPYVIPQKYWGEDAKQLNNYIFDFLQKKLEDTIAAFNDSVLYYAYSQIEYIEGQRESDEMQAGLDASKYIEFDLEEKYNQQRMEISHLAIVAKHILHTILKVQPHGIKALVDTDWYYLLALSTIINDTIQRSDHLHYSLSETGIEITDIYEMIDIDKSSSIDFDGYYQRITSSKISSVKKRLFKEPIALPTENPKKMAIFDEQLNEAWFKDFGFYLDDMVVVLNSIGRYDFKRDSHFPLNLISFDSLNKVLQEFILESPSPQEIKKILDFLSLDFSTFKTYSPIDYSIDRLMRKKERINLSPFIRMNDKYLFGNQLVLKSAQAWAYPLIDGDIPFTIADDSSVKIEIDRIHKALDIQLEQDAYEIAKNLFGSGLVEKNILNFKRLSANFIKQPPCGEIDLLIANPYIKTLFVIDAKNMNRKLFTSAIASELKAFFHGGSKKKSYLEKLNMKVDFIRENIDEILNYFKIEDTSEWKIKKGFVVNVLYLSAFYEENVDFILLDDLAEYVSNA